MKVIEPVAPISGLSIDSGQIILRGATLKIEEYHAIKIIGQGANGTVILIHNNLLGRKEALKIWYNRRISDQRDKRVQGMLEAQKLASAQGERSIKPFHAGIWEGYFYMTMEYYPCKTLYECQILLDDYYKRYLLIEAYLNLMVEMTNDKLLHGDPHLSNVLIGERGMILCDFGTSIFSGKKNSRKRHWNIVTESTCKMVPEKYSNLRATIRGLSKKFEGEPRWFIHNQILELLKYRMLYVEVGEENVPMVLRMGC